MPSRQAPEELLTPSEVAALFRVDPKTVSRWASTGKLSERRTLGGHRRFRAAEVYALLGHDRAGSDEPAVNARTMPEPQRHPR